MQRPILEHEDAPDVIYEKTKGDRAFFSAIINQAVRDACLVIRPKLMPLNTVYIRKQYKILVTIFVCLKEIIALDGEIEVYGKSKKSPELLLLYMLRLLENKQAHEEEVTTDDNVIAYEARRFINAKNEHFRYYCERLGFSPKFMERKCRQYIVKYDQGLVGKLSLGYEMP